MVMEFHTYVARIAMQLGNISEEEFLNKFICGLKPNTWTKLEFRDLKTIVKAVKWADTFDTRHYRKKDNQRYYGSFSSNSTSQDDNCREPMQIDVLKTVPNDITTPIQIDAFETKSQQVKLIKLTDKERIYLWSIGACFKCCKTGHMAREYPSKANNNNSWNSKR